ncbi:MAG TPA: AAA family ATPase [Thermoguttaceae bacterium]|nr:AAA family ATPase [Thermoguttaceae bacterium]
MLTTLELERYRGFERYRLSGLTRVNLLVGKNNCGKTSLLEAVHLIVSGGDPRVLNSTAWHRGEVVYTAGGREEYRQEGFPCVSHFFHGHELRVGAYFAVRSSDGFGEVTVRVVEVYVPDEILERAYRNQGLDTLDTSLGIRFEGSAAFVAGESQGLPVSAEGVFLPGVVYGPGRVSPSERREVARVLFIAPDSLEPRSMGAMWNRVISERRESEVIRAMRILAPDLTDIFFLSGENAYRHGGHAGILAAFEGTQHRHPLGSHGDGMRRLLALSLSLTQAEGGVLLVDEIDTGLHYSIMGDMWRLVTEAARRSNVQVFATTHSSDCVRGLAWLCENHPDLAKDVSLQKIDCELEEAVALHGEEIVLAVNQGMEVR